MNRQSLPSICLPPTSIRVAVRGHCLEQIGALRHWASRKGRPRDTCKRDPVRVQLRRNAVCELCSTQGGVRAASPRYDASILGSRCEKREGKASVERLTERGRGDNAGEGQEDRGAQGQEDRGAQEDEKKQVDQERLAAKTGHGRQQEHYGNDARRKLITRWWAGNHRPCLLHPIITNAYAEESCFFGFPARALGPQLAVGFSW